MWFCPRDGSGHNDSESRCYGCGYERPSDEKSKLADSTTIEEKFINACKLLEKAVQLRANTNDLKAGVVVLTAIILILLAIPYFKYDSFTIFRDIVGIAGDSEKRICSIVLLILTIMPAVVIFINLKACKRKLPIAISVLSGSSAAIYCYLIAASKLKEANLVLLLITICFLFNTYLTVRFFKNLQELEKLELPIKLDTIFNLHKSHKA